MQRFLIAQSFAALSAATALSSILIVLATVGAI